MAASIDDVVKELQFISSELKVATGVISRYNKDNEKVKEEEKEVVAPNLSSSEKTRYKSIAEQFRSVLGFDAFKEALFNIEKKKKESERVSHIARHVATPTIKAASKPESTGLFSSLTNWLKSLGLGTLLTIIGGIGLIATSMLKLGSFTGVLQGITKYASLTGLKSLITSIGKFVGTLTAPFQKLSILFTGKTLGGLVQSGISKMGGSFLTGKFPTLFKFLSKGLPFLKSIPIIGPFISFYLAWDRFRKGDVNGGLIEAASGIALFSDTRTGRAISIGLDMVNVFRDLSGRTQKEIETGSTTGTWLKDKMSQFSKNIEKDCKDWPVIGPLIKAYEHFEKNEWQKGIDVLSTSIPVIGKIRDFFFKKEVSETGEEYTGKSFAEIIKSAWNSTVDQMKDVPIIGDLLTAVDCFSSGRFNDGLKSLKNIVPGIQKVIDFLTPSPTSQQQLKSLVPNINTTQKSFAEWVLERLGVGWLFDGSIEQLFGKTDSKELFSFIKDKVSELYGKVKDFFIGVVSSAGDLLKNMMNSDSDMSMQFINVITKLKPSIEKLNKDLQFTFTSSLKENLNALNQIEAVLYMQKDILDENRSLLREIANNTRNAIGTILSSGSNDTSSIMREEKTFTRRSYINDVRSMNAVVRESLA
jgi:hypothetical protein